MTKLLYIPTGQYISFAFHHYRTTTLELVPDCRISTMETAIEYVLESSPKSYFREINNLPDMLLEEEFEIIHD